MSVHLDSLLLSKRVLLLQGPLGGFFSKFSQWLNHQGLQCFKVNFNGGDEFFSKDMHLSFSYKGEPENFSTWVGNFIESHDIGAIVCFGDCRYYHQVAKKISIQKGIKFFAFEEGYIRPNYVTFEENGVNFYSNFLVHLKLKQDVSEIHKADTLEVNTSFKKMVWCSILYYFFMWLYTFKYPKYMHHRMMGVWTEIYYWCWSGFRRIKNAFVEKSKFESFMQQHKFEYFVFALQVHNDFQIRTHSHLRCVQKYIETVVESFAQHANPHHHLVLKHHPMDRGYRHYGKLIKKLADQHGVTGRVHYFCDIHLPSLLKNSIGFVTVNSTTGIQALYHDVPVKVLGHALYNLPKLTNQHKLSYFWRHPGVVDSNYFKKFRQELVEYSQLNGSFYGDSPWMQKSQFNKKMNITDTKIVIKI